MGICHACLRREATRGAWDRQSTWQQVCDTCFGLSTEKYLYEPPLGGRLHMESMDDAMWALRSAHCEDAVKDMASAYIYDAISILTRERDEARAEVDAAVERIKDIADNVLGLQPADAQPVALLDAIEAKHSAVRIAAAAEAAQAKAYERARVVAWLRGQGAWEKQHANAIEAGEHDK